jgi:hypothetical protein
MRAPHNARRVLVSKVQTKAGEAGGGVNDDLAMPLFDEWKERTSENCWSGNVRGYVADDASKCAAEGFVLAFRLCKNSVRGQTELECD